MQGLLLIPKCYAFFLMNMHDDDDDDDDDDDWLGPVSATFHFTILRMFLGTGDFYHLGGGGVGKFRRGHRNFYQ